MRAPQNSPVALDLERHPTLTSQEANSLQGAPWRQKPRPEELHFLFLPSSLWLMSTQHEYFYMGQTWLCVCVCLLSHLLNKMYFRRVNSKNAHVMQCQDPGIKMNSPVPDFSSMVRELHLSQLWNWFCEIWHTWGGLGTVWLAAAPPHKAERSPEESIWEAGLSRRAGWRAGLYRTLQRAACGFIGGLLSLCGPLAFKAADFSNCVRSAFSLGIEFQEALAVFYDTIAPDVVGRSLTFMSRVCAKLPPPQILSLLYSQWPKMHYLNLIAYTKPQQDYS